MRRRIITTTAAVLAVAVAGLGLWHAQPTEAQGGPPAFELPPQAREIAPNVYDLGVTTVDGRAVQGTAYVHTRPNAQAARPSWAGGGGGTSDASSCYSFTKGRLWKSDEPYVYDAASAPDGVNLADALAAATNGAGGWDDQVPADIFGSGSNVAGLTPGILNDKNEVAFGSITDSNTIAVTITWAYRGPPSQRNILEWDMIIDPDWGWGTDAGMHLPSIVAHEVGHGAGMGHTDTTTLCNKQTMYPSAAFGETTKATLEAGDIAGIAALYK